MRPNEWLLSKEHAEKYLEKIGNKTMTADDVRELFVCMSEEAQNKFLSDMREHLSEEEWNAIVIHLKGYDLAMLGDFREKWKKVKEDMALAAYEELTKQK